MCGKTYTMASKMLSFSVNPYYLHKCFNATTKIIIKLLVNQLRQQTTQMNHPILLEKDYD